VLPSGSLAVFHDRVHRAGHNFDPENELIALMPTLFACGLDLLGR